MDTKHVQDSIDKSHNNKSKLVREVFEIKSLTGTKNRHLVNNLCSYEDKSLSYLEVGCYYGSSVCSALYQNSVRVVGVDTWNIYDGDNIHSQIACKENAKKWAEKNKTRFMTGDYKTINKTTLGKFNIFYFDVEKSNTFDENVLKYYDKNLKDIFVYIRSGWNDKDVSSSTYEEIENMGYKISFKNEVFTATPYDSKWANGVGIFLLEK